MPRPIINLTGEIFGRLTVLDFVGHATNRHALWHCRCACGREIFTRADSLRSGQSRSCGCLNIHGYNLRHGDARKGRIVPEWQSWSGMHSRCYNSRSPAYENYGGRGIRVCAHWHDYENFLVDMGRRPSPAKDYSLDRINNDGNHEPGNCRWATRSEQQKNKRPYKKK